MQHFEKRIPVLLDLGLRESALPQVKKYIAMLWDANKDLNLFSRQMPFEDLIDNHLIDCLLPLKKFPTQIKKVADFGTGGGLPGVLYAIQFPEMSFQLFEKSIKKRIFLERCKEVAPNLEIHGEIPPKFGKVDIVIARAFKPLEGMLEVSREYYLNKGKYFLMKARREKIDEEIRDATKKFKDLKVEIIPLKSPVVEVERNLVLI